MFDIDQHWNQSELEVESVIFPSHFRTKFPSQLREDRHMTMLFAFMPNSRAYRAQVSLFMLSQQYFSSVPDIASASIHCARDNNGF